MKAIPACLGTGSRSLSRGSQGTGSRSLSPGAILLIALGAVGCTSPEDEVNRYVTARAANEQAFHSLWKTSPDSAIKSDAAWVAEHEPQLRRIVGPPGIEGVADSGKAHIGFMSGMYDGEAPPDGLLFKTTDSLEIFVTDTVIFNAWAKASAITYGWAKQLRADAGVAAILREPYVFSLMFGTGAAGFHCADLPDVRGAVTATLIEYSQDPDSVCSPDYAVVTAVSGRRLLATQRAIPDSAKHDPRRVAALGQALVDRLVGR